MSSRSTRKKIDSKSVTSQSSITSPSSPWYHPSLRTIVIVLLPFFSLAGFYGTMILGDSSGTFKTIMSIISSKEAKFPDTNDGLLTRYTNVGWLDRQLTFLVTFFAPVADMNQGTLSMFSTFGMGQFGAAWALMVLESLRAGNWWRIVSFVGTFGLIFQNITYTVTVPIWLFIYLLTSPISRSFTGANSSNALLVSSLDLRILPFSIALGYILPTFLMGLDFPTTVSTLTHQQFIALWQPFPLWTILIHYFLKITLQTLFASPTKSNNSPLGQTYLNNANQIYKFILTLCLLTHLPILILSLLPPTLIPSTYPTLYTRSQPSFSTVYIPYFPSTDHRVSSLAEGVHTFLIWDLYIGSLAFLLWGILMYRNAIAGMETDGGVQLGWTRLIGKVVVWCALCGPVGALTLLLWERDEIVMRKVKQ